VLTLTLSLSERALRAERDLAGLNDTSRLPAVGKGQPVDVYALHPPPMFSPTA